jgi:hypothetical protein
MRFEYSPQKYLFDGGADIVTSDIIRNVYSTLRSQGYHGLDTSYDKKAYISDELLESDFEPLENTASILYGSDDSFKYYYPYWKHKELDLYLNVSKQEYDEKSEDEVDVHDSYYRILIIFYNPENSMDSIIEFLDKNITRTLPSKNKIDIIIQTMKGFEFREHEIKSPKIDLDTMYNADFTPVYHHIVDKLNTGNKGVVLFYGDPGTGKTSLIKHLTTVVKDKFVFVPISMIGHISSPQFIGDLIKNKGGILVLEDCENFIQDRKVASDSVVSPLLQITDGILSDILDIKIICTFNTDLTKVDEALRREGRLIAEYEFKELSQDRADTLAGKPVTGKKTLANIFNNLTYTENVKEERKIGFGR